MSEIITQGIPPQYKLINDSREVTVEIITPVHVGAASEKLMRKGTDYFHMNDTLYFVEFNKLLKAALDKGVRMDTISNLLAEGKINELQTYLFKTLKIDIDELSYNIIEDFSHDPGGEIRPLIQTGLGVPYIPGSSIKGALRSVLFNYLNDIIDNKTINEWVFDKELNRKVEKERDIRDNELENFLLGKFDQSVMRYIRIFDAFFGFEDTGIFDIYLFNLYRKGSKWESDWKEKFKIVAECFYPSTTSTFRLSLAKPLADIINNKYHKSTQLPKHLSDVLPQNPFEHLFKIINNYTRTHLQREIDFFKNYDEAPDTDLIIEKLEGLMQYTEGSKTCLLRMAYGSGFHGITGDWRFKNHQTTINQPDEKNLVWNQTERRRMPAHYKSRRVVGEDLMGFIKLSF